MTGKILILNRAKSTLEIQDEDNELSFSYIQDITHIEKEKTEYGTKRGIVNIFNGPISAGFVTNVKEIKEVW
jgi:hypothetical protein